MAISGKYGKLDIPKIGEDEPVFILRAQDRLAQGMERPVKERKEIFTQLHPAVWKKSVDLPPPKEGCCAI
ncbi:MAG: hypothetical protein JSW26_26415 [Desulfobacterales bacterium]|nr:MAG: hypothetical protein JSW26_26415 [Desulfobacterales bacterium]